jgi:hypothetical protein
VRELFSVLGAMVMLLWSLLPLWEIQQLDDWRKQMKTNLRLEHFEEQNLESFSVPIKQYSNLKTGDEIDFDGKRYDLMQVKQDGQFFYVIAFNDKKEKDLLIKLGYNIQRSSDEVPLPPLSISEVKWVYVLFKKANNQGFSNGTQFPTVANFRIIACASDIPTPPPEVLV